MSARERARAPAPPRHLSKVSRDFWRTVVGQYELELQHLKLLKLACEALDRAEQARAAIAREGMTFTDRYGNPRKHPAVQIEADARLAFARLLRELDLEGEPHPGYRRS